MAMTKTTGARGWVWALRLSAGFAAAWQLLLALPSDTTPPDVGIVDYVYLYGTVFYFAAVAGSAGPIIALRAKRLGLAATLVLALIAVAILLIGQSSFGLVVYGPLIGTLLMLAASGANDSS